MSFKAQPAQNRTCGFPASGSHLGCVTSGRQVHGPLVCDPAHVTHQPDTDSERVLLGRHFPWSPPLAPSTPRLVSQRRSWTSQLLLRGLTSSASVHHRLRLITFPMRTGAKLPAGQNARSPSSDLLPLYVMGSSTTASDRPSHNGPTHVPSALSNGLGLSGIVSFAGSIAHPAQSLCTLRSSRHLPPRNTRYQAAATPYLDRTCTGWNTPACLAH